MQGLHPLPLLRGGGRPPVGLSLLAGQHRAEASQMMAVSTVVTVPLIILFFFTQRTFVQGITMTGIKG